MNELEKFSVTMRAYCDSCNEITPHDIRHCRDTRDDRPYTDLVCSRCHCITACIVRRVTSTGGGKAEGAPFVAEIVEYYNWMREFGESRCDIHVLRVRLGLIITKYHSSDLHRKEDGGLEYEP